MKSQLKPNRVGSCIWFVVVVATSLSFLGCPPQSVPPSVSQQVEPNIVYQRVEVPVTVHLMPLNDHIIEQVGGLAAMEKTQLFISDVLNLKRVDINQEFMAVGERIVRTSDIFNDNIIIRPDQSGTLSGPQEGSILNVGFNLLSTTNLVLPFAKQGTGERYEILFTKTNNPEDRIIDFGVARYTVTYGGNERNETPYLQFELKDEYKESIR